MDFLSFLFPKTCLGCHKSGCYFCPSCISKIRLIENQVCPECERPSPYGETHHFCQLKYSLDGLISFFAYEGIIREAIHQLKFKLVTDLTNELFDLMIKIWKEDSNDRFSQMKRMIKAKKPLVISVPLYWYKENQRGFNQSEIFAQKLANLWNLEFKRDLLIRSKFTSPQAGLNQNQRKENINNAFVLSSNLLLSSYPNILLVDDIWTTGATLKTCGRLLKEKGAAAVWGLTLAR